jgi:hypothetical protein
MKVTMKPGRQPDYNVAAMDKASNAKANVGAAWLNEDGSISIVLNNFVTLTQTGELDLT